MATDLQAAIADQLEALARLVSAIGDPNLTKQDANRLTDQMPQPIWDVSDLGLLIGLVGHSATE